MDKRRDDERQSPSKPRGKVSRDSDTGALHLCCSVSVVPAKGAELLADSLVHNVLDVESLLQLACHCTNTCRGLLADSLQGVQGAFDVTDLCGQRVYGLHGAVQLLAASHQCVHALCTQTQSFIPYMLRSMCICAYNATLL